MTLNDPEPLKLRVLVCFFAIFNCGTHLIEERIVPKWLEIDLDNLRTKFLT